MKGGLPRQPKVVNLALQVKLFHNNAPTTTTERRRVPTMTRKITARDIALATGTSTAAVSRAMRSDGVISDELRQRIRTVAQEMDYQTPSARSVAALTSGTITLVAGDLENPFYPSAANALSQAIHASGRRMILHAVPPGGDVDTVMAQVLDYRSDAAIVTSASMSSLLARECRRRKMPVILFNRVQADQQMTAVTCDTMAEGRWQLDGWLRGVAGG
jgi:DNA-binding LacI/PurR family transcriptional regulator